MFEVCACVDCCCGKVNLNIVNVSFLCLIRISHFIYIVLCS